MLSTRRSVPALLAIVALLAACGDGRRAAPQPEPPAAAEAARSRCRRRSGRHRPRQPQPQPPQPPAPLFTPVAFEALPGWQQDDLRQAWPAFHGLLPRAGAKADWKSACSRRQAVDGGDGGAIRRYFETYFVPNLVRAPTAPTPA
jgi:membrane-bound lytic murein transglycosylase A